MCYYITKDLLKCSSVVINGISWYYFVDKIFKNLGENILKLKKATSYDEYNCDEFYTLKPRNMGSWRLQRLLGTLIRQYGIQNSNQSWWLMLWLLISESSRKYMTKRRCGPVLKYYRMTLPFVKIFGDIFSCGLRNIWNIFSGLSQRLLMEINLHFLDTKQKSYLNIFVFNSLLTACISLCVTTNWYGLFVYTWCVHLLGILTLKQLGMFLLKIFISFSHFVHYEYEFFKLVPCNRYFVSIVPTDGLLLKHQGICSHSAEYAPMRFQLWVNKAVWYKYSDQSWCTLHRVWIFEGS